MPRALAVSPHLDDAAFSCGGTLAALVQAGWDVAVCTLFTRTVANPSSFAMACQLDKGIGPDLDYMAIRRAEDTQACKKLGVSPIWLDFPEAPHRNYDRPAALFGDLHSSDNVHLKVAAELKLILQFRPDVVLAPQAIGGHVDHVQAVRALRISLPEDLPILWWTDFPYSMRPHSHPSHPFKRDMEQLVSWLFKGDTGARLSACAAYSTQIGFQFGGYDGLVKNLINAGAIECFRLSGTLPSFYPFKRLLQ
jgi:LmbE family N-acetylglucosaminyl deacetylase